MKSMTTLAIAAALALAAGAADADSMSLTGFRDRVLPVLVKVDTHGKVTRLSSAIELTPRFDRLLRQTVDEMITGPAMDHGKPVSSQFVMKLGMRATARADGEYDTRFVYLSSSPVPSGEWIWQNEDGHRLALVRADGLNYRGLRYRQHDFPTWRDPWIGDRPMRQPPPPTPAQAAPTSRPGR
jgi:hypothetical protein